MKTRQLCVSTVTSTLVLIASLFTVTSQAATTQATHAFITAEPSQPTPVEPTKDDSDTRLLSCDLIPICLVIPTHIANQQG